VLQRLADTDARTPARLTLSVTPTTTPNVSLAIFALLVAALAISRLRMPAVAASPAPGVKMALLLGLVLLLQPILMIAAGFIAASTLTFAATATAWRGIRPSVAAMAGDLAAGAAFAVIVFVIFTAGLGVALP